MVKSPPAMEFDPWVRKIPWRREWLPTSVFLPGEFHRKRSLVGYNPWGHKSDTTEQLTLSSYGLSVNWTWSSPLGGDGTETLVSQPRCPISCWAGPFPKRVDGA